MDEGARGTERARNVFGGGELDRSAERRRDPAWLGEALANPDTRVLPMHRSRALVRGGDSCVEPCYVDPATAAALAAGAPVFLGMANGLAYFTVELDDVAAERLAASRPGWLFSELRPVALRLHTLDAAVFAYARALLWWLARHRHCGVCGSRTAEHDAGHVLRCTNAACDAVHFPRTDPAVIALVTHGECCLLGNQPSWAPEVYSTLAGFIEPGESAEDALRREVLEETGVPLATVTYHSSQPWPFPGSLMLGFRAEAASRDVRVDAHEIRDARWFTRGELRREVAAGRVRLPSDISIARRLVDEWLGAREG